MYIRCYFYAFSTRKKQENQLWRNKFREVDLPSERHYGEPDGVHHKEVLGRAMPLHCKSLRYQKGLGKGTKPELYKNIRKRY